MHAELPSKMAAPTIVLIIASVASYCGSLAMEAVDGQYGFVCLLFGWISVLSLTNLSWLANFMLWIAAYYTIAARRGAGMFWSCSTALLMASNLIVKRYATWDSGDGLGYSTIRSFGPGFWLWLAAPMLLIIAHVWESRRRAPPQGSQRHRATP
ncbi:hypothetical protein [Ideonella paludis]|uniref:Uncharacterized protein n=1 Tax=Ideonella paludis TaxID=1233411 RepID=A0ABS5DTS1_9BURK|nr:hypothetical protein [Ideonella paludis]MBQ0934528.1 hypothetical protein [Ideonella paludis]